MITFLYLVAVAANSFMMSSIGYGSDTWQWWASMTCIIVCNITGRMTGEKKR